MNHSHSTITSHIKGKHLSYEERNLFRFVLKTTTPSGQLPVRKGCSPSIVSNKIARGSVALYNGHVTRYKASAGQKAYEDNRKNSCRHYVFLSRSAFLKYVLKHFTEDGWSLDVRGKLILQPTKKVVDIHTLDACAGCAVLDGEFTREQIVCTKTLYRYVDLGLFGIRSNNLSEKLKRKFKKHRSRINKKKYNGSVFKTKI